LGPQIPGRFFTTKAQRHQERLRSSYPQISQKDADFEIQIGEIGEIGAIGGSLLPFLVSPSSGWPYLVNWMACISVVLSSGDLGFWIFDSAIQNRQ
jgi:hypothetical protein